MESNWRNFRGVFFLILLTWSITGILGPMVREIASELWVQSEAQIGFITSLFLIVASLLSFIWAIFEDRFSRKYLLIIAGAIAGFSTLLTSFAHNYFELLLFQILAAIGYAAIFPIGFSITMDFIIPEERARAFAILGIANTVGIGFSYLLSGILVDISWRLPLIIVSFLFFVNITALFRIKDPKKGSKEHVLSQLLSGGAVYSFHINRADLKDIVKNKSNLCIIAYNLLMVCGIGSISYYLITMLKIDHNFSSIAATLFVIATYADGILGNIFWGRRADKKFTKNPNGKVIVLLECLIIGPIFLAIAYSMEFLVSNIVLVILFAILISVGAFFTSALISISLSILGEINLPESRATVFSINNFAQTMGRSLGIAFMGIFFNIFGGTSYLGFGVFINLFGGGNHWGFVIMSILYFGGIIFMLSIKKLIPKEISKLNELLKERAKQLEFQSKSSN